MRKFLEKKTNFLKENSRGMFVNIILLELHLLKDRLQIFPEKVTGELMEKFEEEFSEKFQWKTQRKKLAT